MKPRRLPSGAWNCRVMIDGQSYSFTHADRHLRRFRVPKPIPIVSSFQIKKPRKTPNTAPYGVFYCRQRGSNPHKVGVYTYVYGDYAKYHSNPTKKERSLCPAPVKNVCMQKTFFSLYHIAVLIKDMVTTPIPCARLCIFKDRKRTLLRVRFLP